MPIIAHDAPDAAAAQGGYAQAVEVVAPSRLLFISGQVPVRPDGSTPADFATQARVAWANLDAQLRAARMDLDALAKVTIFLARREDAAENRAIRNDVLAGRRVALTVILPAIFDAAWLIEIEAVAAA
jgi:2-iminobutanoate/2-iminopropanoate deaminase